MHPVLFTAFGQPIYSYVVASVAGYGVGVLFGFWLALTDGRSLRDCIDLGIVAVLSALLG